ncbi:SRPBCC family protein [Amycolatopsis taiwanensis]|uniref:SRPBCC family protein n=1 Tax=Amycolatopsis taiwanensis TaxID=342230 RepID=UPI000487A83C|nr:SRPBCC domain-containing protein [Amycolatopsis taiwanensis]
MSEDLTVIHIDQFYAHRPATVWRALTEPELISRWLMPVENFRLEVGHKYTMRGTPMPAAEFSGTVAAEILAIDPERLLRISWQDAAHQAPGRFTITWRLEPEGTGTRMFLEHDGFDPDLPQHLRSREIMSGGWQRIQRQLGEALATI